MTNINFKTNVVRWIWDGILRKESFQTNPRFIRFLFRDNDAGVVWYEILSELLTFANRCKSRIYLIKGRMHRWFAGNITSKSVEFFSKFLMKLLLCLGSNYQFNRNISNKCQFPNQLYNGGKRTDPNTWIVGTYAHTHENVCMLSRYFSKNLNIFKITLMNDSD